MPRKSATTPRYEDVALGVLVYEFDFDDPAEADRKIKRRLRDKKLGPYDAARIARLRRFKDAVQKEVHRFDKSRYYLGARGPVCPQGRYADLKDFDRARMVRDYAKQFRGIPRSSIVWFVDFAVFSYYVR